MNSPDETELVVEPQINEAPKESTRETIEEPDEGVKGEKSFPYRFVKKKEEPIDYMSICGKFKVTIPCLQAVTLSPYDKYIKEFITGRAREEEKIAIGGSTSAMVHKKLPPKKSDPGWCDLASSQMFTDQDIEEAIKDFCQKSLSLPTGREEDREKTKVEMRIEVNHRA